MVLRRALKDESEGLGKLSIEVSDSLLEIIGGVTGDGRSALNLLNNIVWASDESEEGIIQLTEETVKECIQNKGFNYDKKGDIFYNLLLGLEY